MIATSRPAIFITTFILLLNALHSHAQVMILHDPISARVFQTDKYSGINGSPFLKEDWTEGSVTTPEGIYENVQVKLDAYSNILYFRKDDDLHEFQYEVLAFVLKPNPKDSTTYQYFHKQLSGPGLKHDQFVQVLVEGPVSLYRSDMKLMADVNEINAGVVKTFNNSTRYYISRNGGPLQLIKITKKDIFDIIKDKETQVQTYVSNNNLSTKKESDLITILRYYNSL